MAASATRIFKARAEALLRGFVAYNPAPIIVLNPGLVAANAYRFGCTVTPVGRRRATDQCFILRHPHKPSECSVWALPGVKGHKRLYETFLSEVYGIPDGVPKGWNVDHLRAKAITPENCFIRLEAVTEGANKSFGAGYESRMHKDPKTGKENPITQARKARGHVNGSLSWMVALKLAGGLSPLADTNPDAEARQEDAVNTLVQLGFSRAEVEQGLKALLDLADRTA